MPSLLLHLTAVERLAADTSALPREMVKALDEDLEYARLGAALPDLPLFEGLRGGLEALLPRRQYPYFARVFHGRAPVAMGLKMAELVSNGALVGREPGLAMLSGYFTHICLDRQLHPIVDRLVLRERRTGETSIEAHRRVEWTQALLYARDFHGRDLLGEHALRAKFQVLKRHGMPTRGIGRGMYELIRLASQETLNAAPLKSQVDAWVRGLYLEGLVLSSPIGRTRRLSAEEEGDARKLYRGEDFDVSVEVEKGLELARRVLPKLWSAIERQSFTARARAKIFAELPEGSVESSAA